MNDKLCPTLSYNKPQLVGCYKEHCPFYNETYGCIQAFNMLCDIEQWQQEKKMMEHTKKNLKASSDIAIR